VTALSTLPERRPVDPAAPRVPAVVVDVDVAEPLPFVDAHDSHGRRHCEAWVTVRAFTEPVAQVVVPLGPEGLTAEQLAAAVAEGAGGALRGPLEAAGVVFDGTLPVGGVRAGRTPPFLAGRAAVLAEAPAITAVVCTRGSPPGLEACLVSLVRQEYPDFEILVVDNAPEGDGCEALAGRLAGAVRLRRVVEPRPGLSFARNRAIDEAASDLLAFIDDDEVADPNWLTELARGYAEHPEAGAVAGLVLPGELDTAAQVYFERWGGHSKGRGFEHAVFSAATVDPLFPRPCFGTGANMSFRRSALERIGRFDEALGAGSPTRAGEDTLAFSELLYLGETSVYRPSALTRHFHRRELDQLATQFEALGSGLSSFYASLAVRHPRVVPALVGLVVRAGGHRLAGRGAGGDWEGMPAGFRAARRRGLLRGPFRYAVARRRLRRRPAGPLDEASRPERRAAR